MSREQSILAAASDLFSQRSFAAVGVDEIGTKAGVTGPALYRYFSGKDDILAALFDQAIDGLIGAMSAATGPQDPIAELRQRIQAHLRYVVSEPALASVWIREEHSLGEPHRRRLRRRQAFYIDDWSDNLIRCYPQLGEIEAHRLTRFALGALNSISQWPAKTVRSAAVQKALISFVQAGLDAAAKEAAEPAPD